MLRWLRRRFWLLLMVALGVYLVWSAIGLQQSPNGTPRADQTQSKAPSLSSRLAGAKRGQATNTPRPKAPQKREGTFILLGAGSVTHNSVVTVNGYGFPKGESIVVEFRGKVVGKTSADKGGSFAGVNVRIGTDMAPGRYTIRAIGQTLMAETAVEIVPGTPYAVPSTYSGKPASRVSFTGGGFRGRERIAVHFDSLAGAPIADLTSSETGAIAVKNLTVPFAAEGDHTFILLGEESRSPAIVPFSVLGFYPWVTLSTYNAAPERPIGFTGQDWAPGEQVAIYVNGRPGAQAGSNVKPAAVVRADDRGRLNVKSGLSLPIEAIGKNTLFFRGQISGKTVAATLTVEPFAPQLQLTAYAGKPATQVAFIGDGYARRERITAYLGGVEGGKPVATFTADDSGSFKNAGSFSIPFGTPAGKLPLTVVGETSKTPVSVTFAVLPLTPSFTLSLYAGRPGDVITLSGAGFAGGERIHVYLGEERGGQEVASVAAGRSGTFKDAASFALPAKTRSGKLKLTAVGEQSHTPVSAEFEVLPPEAWGALSAYAGPPGTSVRFSGRGYVGGEDVLIYAGDRHGKPIATVQAGPDGVFRDVGSYTIPKNARDKVDFVMVGRTSEAEAKATFNVTSGGEGE